MKYDIPEGFDEKEYLRKWYSQRPDLVHLLE
jgi:hypothetical protein